MKYPLKWYHRAGREFLCYWTGHKIKTARRRVKNFEELSEMGYDQIPYALRKMPNCMWENIAWWGSKCIRCRQKNYEHLGFNESFTVRFIRAARATLKHSWFMITYPFKYKQEDEGQLTFLDVLLHFLAGIVGTPGHFYINFSSNFEWGYWFAELFLDAEDALLGWADKIIIVVKE